MSIVPYRRRPRDRALDFFRAERLAMAAELATRDVDVVHSHWSYEFGWVGVNSKIPNVLSVHDAPLTVLRRNPDPYRLLRTLLAYRVSRRAGVTTAVSPDLAMKWSRQMRSKGRARVIPNISPEFDAEVAVAVGKSAGPVVLEIADASPLKNVRILLEAFKKFRTAYDSAELKLIGNGLSSDEALAEWAKHAGLTDGVSFLGKQSRSGVSASLTRATMLCHASLEESQGMCFLEAMSHSVPVIGGLNSGGVAWTLDDGRAGLLVDVSRSDEIFAGMVEIHTNTERTSRLVARGKELVSQRYSSEAVTAAYIRSYHDAILGFGSPHGSKR
jgi:glycosyltransferase involved in cell wall biosynthesis